MDTPVNSPATAPGGSSQVLAVVYWLIVTLPLAWGVYQTAQKSKALFQVTSGPAMAAPAAAAATPPEK